MHIEPFRINISDPTLNDLRERLARARFPNDIRGSGWSYGTNLSYMKELVEYWLDAYDWREQEAMLNQMPQFLGDVDGRLVHFVHARSDDPDALPVVVTHGWPGSIMEFYKVVGPLTDPLGYGGDERDAFHVICPSMTGYGWSDPWLEPGCDIKFVAQRQVALLEGLGYERYGVQGGDWGSLASAYMAILAPDKVCGLHLNMCPSPSTDDAAEARARGVMPGRTSITRAYYYEQKGYAMIQSLKPDQLCYALNDSPLGLAAWIVQAFYMWGDIDGDIESRFTKDELITNLMIYWVTESMPSAIRLYRESLQSGRFGPPDEYVNAPTGVALFKDVARPKREWAENTYNIVRWTEMPTGGHFAALEEPDLLIEDVRAFFRPFR
jgi:epoxide hydrolase